MDLGACWIHSYSKTNPLCKYVNKFDIKPEKNNLRVVGRVFYDGETGKHFDDNTMDCSEFHHAEFFRTAQETLAKSAVDISLFEGAKTVY